MSKLRVSFIPALEKDIEGFTKHVDSVEEAVTVMKSIAEYTLFLHKVDLMHDYSNMSFLEVFNEETEQWEEWYDEASDHTNPEEYIDHIKWSG